MISNNVMKLKEYNDLVFYRIGCDCMSPDCDLTLSLEYIGDFNMVELTIYSDLEWNDIHDLSNWTWPFMLWNRIKTALKVLVKGKIRVESGLVIQNKEHLKAFADALEEGIKHLEGFKKG